MSSQSASGSVSPRADLPSRQAHVLSNGLRGRDHRSPHTRPRGPANFGGFHLHFRTRGSNLICPDCTVKTITRTPFRVPGSAVRTPVVAEARARRGAHGPVVGQRDRATVTAHTDRARSLRLSDLGPAARCMNSRTMAAASAVPSLAARVPADIAYRSSQVMTVQASPFVLIESAIPAPTDRAVRSTGTTMAQVVPEALRVMMESTRERRPAMVSHPRAARPVANQRRGFSCSWPLAAVTVRGDAFLAARSRGRRQHVSQGMSCLPGAVGHHTEGGGPGPAFVLPGHAP